MEYLSTSADDNSNGVCPQSPPRDDDDPRDKADELSENGEIGRWDDG